METLESERNPSRLKKIIIEIIESLELIKKINDLGSSQKGNLKNIEKKIGAQEITLRSLQSDLHKKSEKIEELFTEFKICKETLSGKERKVSDQLYEVIGLINDQHQEVILNITDFSDELGNKLKILTKEVKILITFFNNYYSNNAIPSIKQPKNSRNMENKDIFKMVFSSAAFLLITLVVIFIFIVPTQSFRQDLNKVDEGVIKKIEKIDSIYFVNVKRDITSQLDAFETLTIQDKREIQRSLNSQIEKRNEIFIGEVEKGNNNLMKNVVIINLIGRYVVILCCILAFVSILRSFASSKSKDDIFE
jgi:hypothetical protein